MADVLRRGHSPVMAAGVLLDRRRAKVRADVLLGDRRAKVRVDVLQGNRQAKVRADVLQGNRAVVDDPKDRHPVAAAEEATGVATAVAAKAVAATNNRADNRDPSPVAAGDTVCACSKAQAATRNITGFASLAPSPRAWKIRLPDQVPATAGA